MDVTITNAGGRIEIVDLRNDLTNNYDVLKDGLRLFNIGDIIRITFIDLTNIEINYNEVELINGGTSIEPRDSGEFFDALNLILGDYGTGGAGVSELNDLTDVLISAPSNAEVLTYDSATLKWVNLPASGGSGGGDMFKSVYDTDNDGVVDKAETVQIIVRNSTGSTLTKGQIVYLSGATGNRPNAVLSQANAEATSSKTIGWVTANINNNSDGYVGVSGSAHDLDTSAFTAGDALWLSPTVAGGITATMPTQPDHAVFIGYCARSHPTQGRIVFKIQNGFELQELHNVLISSVANNEGLFYEAASGLWKNKTIESVLGAASASQNGYLTSTDWNTFNNKALNYKSTTDGVATSTANNTLSQSVLIPGGTFAVGNIVRVYNRMRATGIGAAKTFRIYVNTSNDLLGTPILIATMITGANALFSQIKRDLVIKTATNTEVTATAAAISTDDSNSNSLNSLNIDWSTNKYLIFAVQRGSAADVLLSSSYLIERL